MALKSLFKNIILLTIFVYSMPFLLPTIKSHYNTWLEQRTQIGIVTIKNTVNDSSVFIDQFNTLFKNPSIKGIVVKIDCSETSAGTSQIIFHELQGLKKEFPKPFITLIENTCLSGAYLIASASDSIIAPESALIGGIGTYTLPNTLHQTAEIKDTLHQEIYQQTVKLISATRKISLANEASWADEKIFTGKQAVSLGLINATGSMQKVIALLKEKTIIDGEIEWVERNKTALATYGLTISFCH